MKTGHFEVMKVSVENEVDVKISFGPRDKRELATPHSDALVCIADIASCFVHRMKFLVGGGGIGEVYGNQLSSKECYVKAVAQRCGKNKRTEQRKRQRKLMLVLIID